MLAPDVIQAVADEQFTIYAVDNIDQAIEILMAQPAGEMTRAGRYPRKSIHGMVLNKLSAFSDLLNGVEE